MLEKPNRLLCYITLSTFAGHLDVGKICCKNPHQFGRTLTKNSSGATVQKALAPGAAFITLPIKPAEKANQTQATEKRGRLPEPPSARGSRLMGLSVGQQWGRGAGPCFCLHDGHWTSQLSTKIKD